MFDKVLVPVDFSDHTDQIIDVAIEISRKFSAEIHLLHVVPTMDCLTPYESFLAVDNLIALQKQIAEEARQDLERIGQKLSVPTTIAVRSGAAFLEIVDYAKAEGIGLVVMATHGRGALEHILLGSVTEKVVRRASCPVLTIRPKVKSAGPHQ